MLFVIVKQGEKIVSDTLLQNPEQGVTAPLFEGEKYEIEVYNSKAQKIQSYEILAARNGVTLKLMKGIIQTIPINTKLLSKYIGQLVLQGEDDELKQKLIAIGNMHQEIQYNMDTIRGGRLEHLVYLLFLEFKKQGTVEEVKWHGHLDQYGVPYPAPGRSRYSLGNPDILVYVADMIIVVELTLIGKTRMQWSAEGESVPDHILGVKNANPNKTVIGLFSAPDFHRPDHLKAVAAYHAYSVTLKLCRLDELVSILTRSCTKAEFIKIIISLP